MGGAGEGAKLLPGRWNFGTTRGLSLALNLSSRLRICVLCGGACISIMALAAIGKFSRKALFALVSITS